MLDILLHIHSADCICDESTEEPVADAFHGDLFHRIHRVAEQPESG